MPSVVRRAKRDVLVPVRANYDPTATTNDDSCMYTGGLDPVGTTNSSEVIKPFEDASTPPMGVRPFRKQAGDIPTCGAIGQPVPIPSEGQGVLILNPEWSGCGRCQCQIPDGANCPDVYGQWLGGFHYLSWMNPPATAISSHQQRQLDRRWIA